jgi:signal transduction histidine kinase
MKIWPNPRPNEMPEARIIARHLFQLVFRALAGVLICLVALLVLVAWAVLGYVNSSPENLEPLLVYMLESHYEARDSWTGVESVFAKNQEPLISIYQRHWQDTILLDDNNRVVVDHGTVDTSLVGTTYTPSPTELHFALKTNNQVIGTLIFTNRKFLEPLLVFFPVMGPFTLLAVLMATLALVIGLLLVRRVVDPLAEVIAAAHSVSAGNLAARAKMSGLSDLQVLSDSFNQMAESLEQNDRERRELLAIVAHELRTPLTVLRGRLEGIVDGIYPADEAHIAGALEETYLLERLVDDLRLLALAEARQLHFDRKPVDVSDLARRTVELFGPEAEEKNIQLKLDAESGLPELEADPQRLGQAVANLIGNALRYVPEGGQVDVIVKKTGEGAVSVVVSDNGPGVPPADLPHIFDRFWRGDAARTRLIAGTGLGLAIAKELVEAQGGSISARNRSQGGLEAVISFGQSLT